MTASRHMLAVTAALLAVGVSAPSAQAARSAPDARAFGKHCQAQSKKRVAGSTGTPFSKCVTAMARLARAKSRSPQIACARLTRKRTGAGRRSAYDRCVRSGRTLIRYGNGIDRSYLEQMIPHHVGAVEMAQMALTSAQSPYVRTLAQSIIASQNAEIAQMRVMAGKLRNARIPAVSLGLSKREMGMDHDMSHLVGANPFDIHWIDMMIPHHQGAITMSRVLFVKGVGAATRRLAEQINLAQSREIEQMRQFRAVTTGSAAPAAPGAGGDEPHH